MSITSMPVRRFTTALALSTCLTGALSGAVLTPGAHADDAPSRVAAEVLTAKLRASGDADGSGSATVKLNKAKGKVCATIAWRSIQTPGAAHIHQRSDGAVVVDLSTAVTGGAKCTTGVAKRLIGRILANPRKYYVNVHNATYPAGAIQGNLHR